MEAALVRVDGYKSMKADVGKEEVQVAFDPKKTDPQKLAQSINDNTSYKATIPSP